MLASYVASVEDLTEVGFKALHARALFDLIAEWKARGLPQSFVLKSKGKLPAVEFNDREMAIEGFQTRESINKRFQEINTEKFRLEDILRGMCPKCNCAKDVIEKMVLCEADYGDFDFDEFDTGGCPTWRLRKFCTTCNRAYTNWEALHPDDDFPAHY